MDTTIIASLDYVELGWLLLGAILVGMEKGGIKGLSMIVVPIYAIILGGKASSGLVLLLFLMGDCFAIGYYFKFVRWQTLYKILGPALLGVIIGGILGDYINDQIFENLISIILLLCLVLIITPRFSQLLETSSHKTPLALGIGFLTGFSTMIANVSSPILAIYFLTLKFPKLPFVATIVWFFFIINLLKLPFHIWSWGTIQIQTFQTALYSIPAIGIGFLIGVLLLRKINERLFRYLILAITFIATIRLLGF